MMLAVGAFAMGLGTTAAVVLRDKAATKTDSSAATKIWQQKFADLAGKKQDLSQWKGKPLVLNFWATWCAPCREEMPEFMELHKQYEKRVGFVGIAIDNPAEVQKFVKELKIEYPILLGEQDALDLMRAEGNRVGGLPFTLIFDAKGNKVAVVAGRLTKAKLEAYLKPLVS